MRPMLIALTISAAVLLGARIIRAEEVVGPPGRRVFRSGFDSVPAMGGPNSTNSALRLHDTGSDTFYRLHGVRGVFEGYYAFKRRVNERYGVAFGMDYNALYQAATTSATTGSTTTGSTTTGSTTTGSTTTGSTTTGTATTGTATAGTATAGTATSSEDEAAGGVFRLYGSWAFLGRGRPTSSHFVFRLENRHRLGTSLAPTAFGQALGSLFGTATSFDGWGWGITNCQWQQRFLDGRVAFAVGQVDARDWIDVFPLSNWRTALLSPAVMYPVTHLPSAGLGGAGQAYLRSGSTPYVIAGIFDANGHPDAWGGDTFFGDREFYSCVSVGWVPAFDRSFDDNVRVTYWHQDAREQAGKPEAWGLAFSAFWRLGGRWRPFLRGGWAEGGLVSARAAAVAGVGLDLRDHDLLGGAVGWGTPWMDGSRDQTTFELFYRLQLGRNFGLTPDVQIVADPSENPDESVIGIFSLRAQFVL